MRRSSVCALRAAAVALLAACPAQAQAAGGAGSPARAALLRRADLGGGWRVSAPAATRVPPLTCSRFRPSTKGALQTSAAASPTYAASSAGPFVSQTAYSYATAAQQARVWRAVVRRRLLACVAASLSSASSGVSTAISSERLMVLPRLPSRGAGYSVSASATSAEVPTEIYLDAVVLGAGQTVTEISVSSLNQRQASTQVLRLARIIARRIARR